MNEDKYKETIRCMSEVFDEIALMLGIEPHNYGDPDLLFDSIDELKDSKAKLQKQLDTMAGALIDAESILGAYTGDVESNVWDKVEGVLPIGGLSRLKLSIKQALKDYQQGKG